MRPTAHFGLTHGAIHAAKGLGIQPHVGAIASSDTFYDPDPERHLRWAERGVLAVEMEAAVLFTIGALRSVKTACILTVSDLVGSTQLVRIADDDAGAGRRADDAAGAGRGGGREGVTATVMIVNPAAANGSTARQWPDIARRAAGARPRRRRAPDRAARTRDRAGGDGRRRGGGAGGGGGRRRHRLGGGERHGRSGRDRPRRGAARARDATSSARSASPRTPTARWRWRRMRPPAPSTWAASATRAATARPQSRHFVNVASAGLTGVAADRVNRSRQAAGRDRGVRLGCGRDLRRLPQLAVHGRDRRRAHRTGLQQRDRRQLPLLRRAA